MTSPCLTVRTSAPAASCPCTAVVGPAVISSSGSQKRMGVTSAVGNSDARNQFVDAFVRTGEGVHAEDRLLPVSVEFQIGPVDGVGPVLLLRKLDEITTDFGPRGLGRHRHGPLDLLFGRQPP